MRPPAEWESRPWPMIVLEMVIFSTVAPLLGLMENVSSRPQEKEQWSNIMSCPLAMPAQSLPLSPCLPMRKRMWRTMMLLAPENETPLP